jgi:threonine/homoserine/homoserine lactone efflux protein
MPEFHVFVAFALVAVGMVITPGPNMIYLISRSVCQGRVAGLISLAGVATAFLFYMISAALGITALIFAVPYAYDGLRLVGVTYLLYLAWQTLKPNGKSPFQLRDLPQETPRQLFSMGLFTSLFNPKVAMLYISLLPTFIDPARGSVLTQSFALGFTQIFVSVSFNSIYIFLGGFIADFLAKHPKWMAAQRFSMGIILAAIAIYMVLDNR